MRWAAVAVEPPFVASVVVAAVAASVVGVALLSEAFGCRRPAAGGPSSAASPAAGPSGVSGWVAKVLGWPSIGAFPVGSSG